MTIKEYYENEATRIMDKDLYEQAQRNLKKNPLWIPAISTLGFGLSFLLVVILNEKFASEISQIELWVTIIVTFITSITFFIIWFILKMKGKNDKSILEEYKKLYLEKSVPRAFYNEEYSSIFTDFYVTLRYQFKNLILDYDDNNKQLRIFKRKFYKPIYLSDIVSYELFDEDRSVYSCKKNAHESIKKLYYNNFNCENIVLDLRHYEDDKIVKKKITLVENVKRSEAKYMDLIHFLTKVFNETDVYLINSAITNNQKMQPIHINNQPSVEDRLMKLQELLNKRLIDKETYEEKKKSIISEL